VARPVQAAVRMMQNFGVVLVVVSLLVALLATWNDTTLSRN
jgi:hypothetical protein